MPFPPTHEPADWAEADSGRVVRPYAITAGRHTPDSGSEFHLTTQVSSVAARRSTPRTATPEQIKIVHLCQDRPLSVSEISAYIDLPINIVQILLSELLAEDLIVIRSPDLHHDVPIATLEAVLNGLRAL